MRNKQVKISEAVRMVPGVALVRDVVSDSEAFIITVVSVT